MSFWNVLTTILKVAIVFVHTRIHRNHYSPENMVRMIFQPIVLPKTPKYRKVAYNSIKKAILSGQLEPNLALFEEQLAEMFLISRTPVREALALLEHEGIITSLPGNRGLFVRQLTVDEFVDIFTANEVIEPFLARRAAECGDMAKIHALAQNVEMTQWYVHEMAVANFLEAGRDFHRMVGLAAGNTSLTETVIRNEERTDLFLMGQGRAVNKESMQISVNEHRSVLQAIENHDPEEAARRIIAHAGSVRSRYSNLLPK